MPNCPQCGAALKDGVRFCTGCGRPVLLDTASSAPERAEPLRQSGPSNQAPSVSPPAEPVSIKKNTKTGKTPRKKGEKNP